MKRILSLFAAAAVSAAASAQSFALRVSVSGMADSIKVVVADDENPDGKALGSAAAQGGNVTVEGNTRMPRLAAVSIFTKTSKGKWGRDAQLRLMVDTAHISISIDKSEAAWRKAVEEEKLQWPNFIDKTNVAKTYSVRAVPSMFLIDTATMDIIASGEAARGEQLAKKLAELF